MTNNLSPDQIQGKILAQTPWEGYISLEELSIYIRLDPTICQENIYRLILRRMITTHPQNQTLFKQQRINIQC